MQTWSFRGSGEPAWVIASSNACERLGPDPRRALGPAAIRAASTGRTHDRTRPMLHRRKKALVNQAPSTHDPKRTLPGSKSRTAAVCCHTGGVLSFRSLAREVLGSETARVHHATRRRGGSVAARGALAILVGPSVFGVLSPLSPVAATRNIEALQAGLRDLGYVEGHNVTSVLRFAGGAPARLPELAAELVALKPDVIIAGSVSGILAARAATRTIPLIFFVIEDPVAMGLVNSITRPGGNITGIWMFGDDSLVAKRLEFLKHVVPGLARIGVIINPGDQTDTIYLKHLPATAHALGIHIVIFEARTLAEIEAVLAASVRDGMQALFVSQSPLFFSHRAEVAAMATRVRLPAIYGFREFAEAGGLM